MKDYPNGLCVFCEIVKKMAENTTAFNLVQWKFKMYRNLNCVRYSVDCTSILIIGMAVMSRMAVSKMCIFSDSLLIVLFCFTVVLKILFLSRFSYYGQK